MNANKWNPIQIRLEHTFLGGIDGVIGGERLGPVIETEQAYGRDLVRTLHGHNILMCSFFEFFIETLGLAAEKAFRGATIQGPLGPEFTRSPSGEFSGLTTKF